MKIWVHTIVHNEDKFIWFAVQSVIDFVDKILIWDTGSTDKTVEIIKEIQKIKGNKVIFKEVGQVNKYQFTNVRQKMLEESKCDWILILDGDEIWWKESIGKVVKIINQEGNNIESVVVPMVVPVGDIYHFQSNAAGKYEILDKKGHYNLRAFSKSIPGLHVAQPYGSEGYFDADNQEIQKRQKVKFLDVSYLHVTHLARSSRKRLYNKFKYELGRSFSKDFKFPEVLYKSRPSIVDDPWKKMDAGYLLKSLMITPLLLIKRRLV